MSEEDEIDYDHSDAVGAINYLFKGFYALFPSTGSIIKTQIDLDDTKRWWLWAFKQAEIIDKKGAMNYSLFSEGLYTLPFLNQSFMPSCGEFITLCFSRYTQEQEDDEKVVDEASL